MPKAAWVLSLWPGLVPLWQRGAWSGLALAIAFSVLLNLALLTTAVWTEVVSPAVQGLAWLAVGGIWLGSLLAARGRWQGPAVAGAPSPDEWFRQAMEHYVQRRWLEAEAGLRQVLAHTPTDVDARLMLASLYRHAERVDDARNELAQLAAQPLAGKWRWEIEREQSQLNEMVAPTSGLSLAWTPAEPAARARRQAAA